MHSSLCGSPHIQYLVQEAELVIAVCDETLKATAVLMEFSRSYLCFRFISHLAWKSHKRLEGKRVEFAISVAYGDLPVATASLHAGVHHLCLEVLEGLLRLARARLEF